MDHISVLVHLCQDFVEAWTNSYPWRILGQGLGLFYDHFMVQGHVLVLNFYTPLATFIRVNAIRSCDLKGGGGDREA